MKYAWLGLLAVMFAGCCSTTDIGRLAPSATIDDGEQAIAVVTVYNVAYSLFGILPIESGVTWKDGPYADRPKWNAVWFRNRCTLDESIASVRAACRELGSNRIDNLVTDSDSWRFWSLFIIKRTVMKSSCTVLSPNR